MVPHHIEALAGDGEMVVVAVVVDAASIARTLLNVQDKGRVAVGGFGFADLRHGVVVTSAGRPGHVVLNFRFAYVIFRCRDEDDFVSGLQSC